MWNELIMPQALGRPRPGDGRPGAHAKLDAETTGSVPLGIRSPLGSPDPPLAGLALLSTRN